MLTRDIFSHRFFVHFLFYTWFPYQILGFGGRHFFSSLSNLNSLFFYHELESGQYCYFIDWYHFFFCGLYVLPAFSTFMHSSLSHVTTFLGAWALCRNLTHADNRVYQGSLYGSSPGCHSVLSLLSVSVTCCVILSPPIEISDKLFPLFILFIGDDYFETKTHCMTFVFALCITFL